MKKNIFILFIIIVTFTFTSCQNESGIVSNSISDYRIAKNLNKVVSSSENYEEQYQELSKFLSSEDCDRIVDKYCSSVFNLDSSSETMFWLTSSMINCLFKTDRIDEIPTWFDKCYQNTVFDNPYFLFWTVQATNRNIKESYPKMQEAFEYSNVETSDIKYIEYQYYYNLYMDIENPEEIINAMSNISIDDSDEYIYIFLIVRDYEAFNRVYVKHFSRPFGFTGADIIAVISSKSFDTEQKQVLYDSLNDLKAANIELYPKLSKIRNESIDNLQENLLKSDKNLKKTDEGFTAKASVKTQGTVLRVNKNGTRKKTQGTVLCVDKSAHL